MHLPSGFAQWLQDRHTLLFIPCIAIAELEQGICKLRRAGGTQRANALAAWLDGLLAAFDGRLLPLDTPSARLAGQISENAMAQGRHPGFADVAIAAIARQANLLLLTRNLKHFDPLGVPCSDPVLMLPD